MRRNDEQFWNKAARKYAASPISDEAGFERTLSRTRAVLPPDARVLELGCGTGTAALKLCEAATSYLGTDISAEMIAIAQEKLQARHPSNHNAQLSFRQATVNTLAGERARYDAIIGFNYLHLAGDLSATLEQIRRLLVPGGLFISKTPCIGDMNRLIRWVIPLMQLVGKAPDVTTFSCTALETAIRDAGFDILANEHHGSKKSDRRPFIVARSQEQR